MRRHGVVEHGRLRSIGLGRGSIAHRVVSGRLHRIHPGVHCVGHPLLSLNGKFMAAALAAGEGAVLSHRSAADLHGLLQTAAARIAVSSAGRRQPSRALEMHRTRTLTEADITTVAGIPVTSIARTLLDLADVAPRRNVERSTRPRYCARSTSRRSRTFLERAAGRRTKVLRATLERHREGPALTRSELEEAFLALVDDAGLRRPQTNTQVCGHEVDAYWPDLGLVVELDSFKYHRT